MYLIDTQVWLWLLTEPTRIREDLLEVLAQPSTNRVVSAATSWEIAIKWSIGRLSLPQEPEAYISKALRDTRATTLDITHSHALRAASLPLLHRDPFDRMLVAQAQMEKLALITVDAAFAGYDVEVISAI